MMTECSFLGELSCKLFWRATFCCTCTSLWLNFALLRFQRDLFPQTVVPALLNMIFLSQTACAHTFISLSSHLSLFIVAQPA